MQYIETEAATEPERQQRRFTTKDRQWDCRFNSPNPDTDQALVDNARDAFEQGRLRYVLVGGAEIGTNPNHDDYGCRHVHLCVVSANPLARSTVLSTFGIKRGYYCVPRNRTLPITGWRKHHTKQESKVDPSITLLYEAGELPAETKGSWTLRGPEEKKRSVDEVLVEIKDCLKRQETEDQIFAKYPRNWMQYGEKIKSMMLQRVDFFKRNGDPNIWLHGTAGAGKSSLLYYIYPNAYKKCLYNRFFDLYNPATQDHVLLEDLDHAAVENLGLNFIKTMCDESGFTFDQKYKAGQRSVTTVLISSQFDIANILDHLDKQIEIGEQGKALRRRFMEIHSNDLQRLLGIKLKNRYELGLLKQSGNTEVSKCYYAWNYVENMPSLRAIPSPEECQALIREAYYKA
nr:nonstructural protein [Flumine parvovirus 12]